MRRVVDQLNRGRVDRVLWFFGDDATFVFPGTSSWSGTYEGAAQIAGWLDRFVATGLELQVRDVVTSGPPWNQRVATRFSDRLVDARGVDVYRNEGVLYDVVRWGRIVRHESHQDTEAVTAFDTHLAATRSAAASQGPPVTGPPRTSVERRRGGIDRRHRHQ